MLFRPYSVCFHVFDGFKIATGSSGKFSQTASSAQSCYSCAFLNGVFICLSRYSCCTWWICNIARANLLSPFLIIMDMLLLSCLLTLKDFKLFWINPLRHPVERQSYIGPCIKFLFFFLLLGFSLLLDTFTLCCSEGKVFTNTFCTFTLVKNMYK